MKDNKEIDSVLATLLARVWHTAETSIYAGYCGSADDRFSFAKKEYGEISPVLGEIGAHDPIRYNRIIRDAIEIRIAHLQHCVRSIGATELILKSKDAVDSEKRRGGA